MANGVVLSFDEIQVLRDALVGERRCNDEVLEMLRTSDLRDSRVAPLIAHHQERGHLIEQMLKKIV